MTTYLFIDGAYLRTLYERKMGALLGERATLDFAFINKSFNAHKAFYFDCLDDVRKERESDTDLAERVAKQEAHFNEIRSLDGFHVLQGTLKGKQLRQKEVDVLLSVHMLTQAFHRNMSTAVLIAGDLDFRPVVRSLVDLGTDVRVVYDSRSGSKDLAWAADSHRPITLMTLWTWSKAHRERDAASLFPRSWGSRTSAEEIVRTGAVDGGPLIVHQNKTNKLFLVKLPDTETRWAFEDLDKLLACVREDYGDITWDTASVPHARPRPARLP